MRKLLLPAAIATAIAFAAIALATGPASYTAADPALDSEEAAFLSLINSYRTQNGRVPLLVDPDLAEAADWMSNDMGVKRYFSHTDSLGRSPWDRMCAYGYCYNTWLGENIAAGYTTAQSVFNGWKASPGHDNNMLGSNFKVMGIARVYTSGSPYGWYWTNDFGGYIAPGAASPPPAPTATPAPMVSPSPAPPSSPSPQPTAVPTPSPQPSCSGDADCDGWMDSREIYLGTNLFDACSNTAVRHDETPDALPPDADDDRTVNSIDAGVFTARLGARTGDSNFLARLDLDANGIISTQDIGFLVSRMGDTC